MNWTGGRLNRYSTVTRRGNPKDGIRKKVHRRSMWRRTGTQDEVDIRPATALGHGKETIAELRWTKARPTRSVGYPRSMNSSPPSSTPSCGSARSTTKCRKVMEQSMAAWKEAHQEHTDTLLETTLPTLDDTEELDISDEEVLRFTRQARSTTTIPLRSNIASQPGTSSQFSKDSGSRHLPDGAGESSLPIECELGDVSVNHGTPALSPVAASAAAAAATITCAAARNRQDSVPSASRIRVHKPNSHSSADVEDARKRLLEMDDWAMLRFCKPIERRRKRGG